MKKLFALVMCLCCLAAVPALADGDVQGDEWLKSLTDEEVHNLALIFQSEYLARSNASLSVPAGIYRVGYDFPVGVYSFHLESASAEVILYGSYEEYIKEFPRMMFDQILMDGIGTNDIGSLFLADGNILVVQGALTASPSMGLQPIGEAQQ